MYSCHLFLISSPSVRSIPFLSFIVPIFAWNIPLVSLIFLQWCLVFPILLFSSISLHWSLRKAFLSLLANLHYKDYSQFDFSIGHLVMSMCRVVSCLVGRKCLLWPVCSGKTLLAFALLHFVLQGQTCLLLQVSFDFLLLHSRTLWWKRNIFWH